MEGGLRGMNKGVMCEWGVVLGMRLKMRRGC
jgi:hypothetical protein